jgi:hypothetical protein
LKNLHLLVNSTTFPIATLGNVSSNLGDLQRAIFFPSDHNAQNNDTTGGRLLQVIIASSTTVRKWLTENCRKIDH